MTRAKPSRLALLRCFACFFLVLPLLAQPLAPEMRDVRSVRAAFVFNLTKYVNWPQPKRDLLIGFVGDAATGETFQKMLEGRTSDSRPIRVVLNPSHDELPRCSILYVADSSPVRILAVLDKVENKNILTVGEADSFAQDGGMIGLVKAGDQIHIHVNLEAMQHSELKISSRLLDLAVIVRSAPGVKH
jgi:hypothetical protein